ncbi:MAG: hypothetical protein JXO22_03625 [Phycisphaerae bacterium]|nr:hypothetical protein [Phycisphaerae bacterium]
MAEPVNPRHRTRQAWSPVLATTAACLMYGLIGCTAPSDIELHREIGQLKDTVNEKDRQLVAQQVTIDELNHQLATVRAIKPEDLQYIYAPEKIVIASLSGGADYDGQPGDDGVTVYIQPVDRDGDVVKVAGSMRIKLFDLQNPEGQTLLGQYEVPVAEAAEHWYGDLWTQHYTIRCPWQTPPAHRQITIEATFTDYLTQSPMSAQATCLIEPRP